MVFFVRWFNSHQSTKSVMTFLYSQSFPSDTHPTVAVSSENLKWRSSFSHGNIQVIPNVSAAVWFISARHFIFCALISGLGIVTWSLLKHNSLRFESHTEFLLSSIAHRDAHITQKSMTWTEVFALQSGSTVARWLALLPHSKEFPELIPRS